MAANAERAVEAIFPAIRKGFSVTSPNTPSYNCIAWAAGDTSRWWWPSPVSYWPDDGVAQATVAAFERAFSRLGFVRAGADEYMPGVERVALYVDANALVTHMAREVGPGRWTSKLGKGWDIEHLTPECLSGGVYGAFSHCLSRVLGRV